MRKHRVGGSRKSRHPIRIVSSWDAALRLVDGKVVKDGQGIEGTLRVTRFGPHDTRLVHVKTAKGKLHPLYLETKRKLHDDWDTDLTNSDLTAAMLEELGVRFASGHDRDRVQRKDGQFRSMRGARGRS